MLFRSRVFRAAVGLVGWALLCCYAQRAGAVEITEFLADNASGLTDEDGDFSDWIEVANPDPITADLSGWRLTDESDKPSKWRFPPGITLAGGERLLVFASGKNRTQPGAPLHTSFSLKREGEYLALLPPSGSTPTTEFRPAYPAQLPDVSYGIGIRPLPQALVGTESVSRLRIPSSTDIDRRWIGAPGNEPYPDAAWTVGTPQVGYDDLSTDVGRILLGYWTFDDAARPRVAVDSSGRNHSGSLLGPAVLASGGSGHTGRAGDRALDLGAGNNGSAVRVDAAAAGGFDQIAALDQVTISLWAFGGPQLPSMNSVFWFDSGGTSGDNRNIMVHLPWSDSVIYFDTAGCCGAETRIARQETDTSRWRGKWNHYVFVKDHGRKEIWQNGVLWHSGTGAQPLKAIKALWLGSAGNATISYPGKLDDVAVWAGALTASEIQSLTAGLSPLAVGTYRSLIRTDLQPTLQIGRAHV